MPRLVLVWAAYRNGGVGEADAPPQHTLILVNSGDQQRHCDQWIRLFQSSLVAGVIAILATAASVARLKQAFDEQLPLVLVDYEGHEAPFPRVEAANYDGTRRAVRHLIELGHTRIGYITGNANYGC